MDQEAKNIYSSLPYLYLIFRSSSFPIFPLPTSLTIKNHLPKIYITKIKIALEHSFFYLYVQNEKCDLTYSHLLFVYLYCFTTCFFTWISSHLTIYSLLLRSAPWCHAACFLSLFLCLSKIKYVEQTNKSC